MSENNRNQRDQSGQEWNQRRDYNRENDFNQRSENYGSQGNTGNVQDSRRRNDSAQGREMENLGGYEGGQDYRTQYGQGNQNWNQQHRDGNQLKNERNQWQQQTGGMQREDFDQSRDQWVRGNANTGNDITGNYGQQQQRRNYGTNEQYRQREQNVYGDDTSNYGNANQGGFDRNWWDKAKNEVSSWFGKDKNEHIEGQHRGKGPKGYQRSPERIKEDVCDRLCDHPAIDASNIDIQVEGTDVILTGTVDSREEKRRAEDIAESISGVQHVENRLRVKQKNSGSEGTGSIGRSDDTPRDRW